MTDRIEGVKCDMIPDEDGDLVFPSAVFYPPNSDNPWIGSKAARRLVYSPERVFYDSKRMLCKQLTDPAIQKLLPFWPFELQPAVTGEILYKLSEVIMYRPEEISQRILEHLRRAVNGNLGRDRREVCIITVPAYFDDEQILATKKE